jgi:hypothetical protein
MELAISVYGSEQKANEAYERCHEKGWATFEKWKREQYEKLTREQVETLRSDYFEKMRWEQYIFHGVNPFDPHAHVNRPPRRNALRHSDMRELFCPGSQATTDLPYWDQTAHTLESGVYCSACTCKYLSTHSWPVGRFEPVERAYTVGAIVQHFEHCENLKINPVANVSVAAYCYGCLIARDNTGVDFLVDENARDA